MDKSLLEKINKPADIANLNQEELTELCEELREEIISAVSHNGGHLAPNLGVIELTVALHRVFNLPKDKIVWDVGHQSYAHKLLTGRRKEFHTLRKFGGLSGFTLRDESEYDCFGAGHAGTAISASMGFAAARDYRHTDERVVAVVGDGSLICGISLEALNNLRSTCKDLIIVINDNKMSISKSVGAIPNYLNKIITGQNYNRFKAFAKMAVKKMPGGQDIVGGIQKIEEATKSLFVPGVFFEEMGLRYIGPINGHQLPELIQTFERVKTFNRPVIVHVITEKGYGCEYAKEAPEKFHGVSAFNPANGMSDSPSSKTTFSTAFGSSLVKLAEEHSEVVAITAAMTSGTGMSEFAKRFHERFFDVGIAEEHALVFAAGLAANGLRPVVAVYATFLQRALDCLFHDICLQKLPVIICADRAGIVEDGPTHHGIYDLSFLMQMPNLTIMCPANEYELELMFREAYRLNSPVVIRYPRGSSGCPAETVRSSTPPLEYGKFHTVRTGKDLTIYSTGRELYTALEAADILKKEKNMECGVVNVRFLRPFDSESFLSTAAAMPIVTIEDNIKSSGLGGLAAELLIDRPHSKILRFGWESDKVIPHGEVSVLREKYGMTPDQIASSIISSLGC